MTSLPRFLGTAALTVLCCAVVLVLSAPAALAHDRLKSSSPAKNATVEALTRIELEFTANVKFPALALLGPGGTRVGIDKPKTKGATVSAAVPEPLLAGAYTLVWRVVSSDGHPIEGEVPFTVTGSPHPTPTPTETTTALASASSVPVSPAPASPDPATPGTSRPEAAEATENMPGWVWTGLALLVVIAAGMRLRRPRGDRTGAAE